MKLKLFAASMMLAFSQFSGAAVSVPTPQTFDFGTVSQTTVIPYINVNGDFDHFFTFKLGSATSVLAGIVGIDMDGDLQAQYRFGVGASPTWGNWSPLVSIPSDVDSGLFSYSQSFSGLQLGQTYWAELKGSATQAAYSVTLAPVPEADSWAMFLAGLGLMGYVARRRKV